MKVFPSVYKLSSQEIFQICRNYEENGKINFLTFLSSFESFHLDNSSKLVDEAFKTISNVIKSKKINPKSAFKKFDTSGDGFITLQEFKKAFFAMKLGYNDRDIETIFKKIDNKNQGKIDYNEFFQALQL